MWKPIVENKYNLKFADIKNLKIVDRSQICEPIFWRNNVVKAWCLSGTTAKSREDSRYGTYNSYWIRIYDEDAPAYKGRIRVDCSSYGGMCGYNFKNFFDEKEIENEDDLLVQEKMLGNINGLIDRGILKVINQL